jgi:saccharopine dehydrogenase (NAD+, L-lysine-forming)
MRSRIRGCVFIKTTTYLIAGMKIGLIREGKNPPDKRVPLTPEQCQFLKEKYTDLDIIVQPSQVRAYKDEEYSAKGIELNEDLSSCDLIMGVKEVNIEDLIPGKKFMFFSHTIKKQVHNQKLMRALLDKHIEMIDYEVLKDAKNKRIIGFGRYAGVVGTYNAFLTLGLKDGTYTLKPAHLCHDRKEMEAELKKVILPKDLKIVSTGFGRVGHGAREIIDLLPIKEVTPEEFVSQSFDSPVFTHLEVEDYYGRKDGGVFNKADFYANPENYVSTFGRFISEADMYIPCHFWSSRSPFIIKREDLMRDDCRLRIVADISCDTDGPIACTVRSSKIADPIYGYNPITGLEDDFRKPGIIAVMAVDNLPCELPKDASEDFGDELIKLVIPCFMESDPDRIIERATETRNGSLMSDFAYLQDYANGVLVH